MSHGGSKLLNAESDVCILRIDWKLIGLCNDGNFILFYWQCSTWQIVVNKKMELWICFYAAVGHKENGAQHLIEWAPKNALSMCCDVIRLIIFHTVKYKYLFCYSNRACVMCDMTRVTFNRQKNAIGYENCHVDCCLSIHLSNTAHV